MLSVHHHVAPWSFFSFTDAQSSTLRIALRALRTTWHKSAWTASLLSAASGPSNDNAEMLFDVFGGQNDCCPGHQTGIRGRSSAPLTSNLFKLSNCHGPHRFFCSTQPTLGSELLRSRSRSRVCTRFKKLRRQSTASCDASRELKPTATMSPNWQRVNLIHDGIWEYNWTIMVIL